MKEATMDANGMDRVERHAQAVKRFRSLSDMHRVPFGTIENLDELIAFRGRGLHKAEHALLRFLKKGG